MPDENAWGNIVPKKYGEEYGWIERLDWASMDMGSANEHMLRYLDLIQGSDHLPHDYAVKELEGRIANLTTSLNMLHMRRYHTMRELHLRSQG